LVKHNYTKIGPVRHTIEGILIALMNSLATSRQTLSHLENVIKASLVLALAPAGSEEPSVPSVRACMYA
jgi:hypothetical protein